MLSVLFHSLLSLRQQKFDATVHERFPALIRETVCKCSRAIRAIIFVYLGFALNEEVISNVVELMVKKNTISTSQTAAIALYGMKKRTEIELANFSTMIAF